MNKNFINYMKGEQKSDCTIKAYVADVQQMLNYVGKCDMSITKTDLIDWKASISNLASASVHRKVAAVKAYFNYLEEAEIRADNPCRNFKNVKVKNREKLPITSSDIKAMLDAVHSKRNYAMIYMLGATGMRVSELTSLTYDQYITRSNDAIVINGKGDKDRVIHLSDAVIAAVDDYIFSTRSRNDATDRSEWLFCTDSGNQVATSNFDVMLKTVAKAANVADHEHISAHTFRHSFATMLAEQHIDLDVIQTLLGHASTEMTRKYIKTNTNRVREAAMSVNF